MSNILRLTNLDLASRFYRYNAVKMSWYLAENFCRDGRRLKLSANIFLEQWRYFSEVRLWPSWSRSGSRLKLSRSSAGDSSSSWSCGSWQQLRRSNDSCGEEPRVRQPGKERCRQPSLARSQAMGVPPVFQMGLSTFSIMVAGGCAKCFKEAKTVDNTDNNLVQNHLYLPSDSRPPLPPS